MLDRTSLKDITVSHLASLASIVQQEPTLLSLSLLGNIVLGLVNSANPAHEDTTNTFRSAQSSLSLLRMPKAVRI